MVRCESCGSKEVKRTVEPISDDRERVTVVCDQCGHERAIYER